MLRPGSGCVGEIFSLKQSGKKNEEKEESASCRLYDLGVLVTGLTGKCYDRY